MVIGRMISVVALWLFHPYRPGLWLYVIMIKPGPNHSSGPLNKASKPISPPLVLLLCKSYVLVMKYQVNHNNIKVAVSPQCKWAIVDYLPN